MARYKGRREGDHKSRVKSVSKDINLIFHQKFVIITPTNLKLIG